MAKNAKAAAKNKTENENANANENENANANANENENANANANENENDPGASIPDKTAVGVKQAKAAAEQVNETAALKELIVKEMRKVTKGERQDIQLVMAYCRKLDVLESAGK